MPGWRALHGNSPGELSKQLNIPQGEMSVCRIFRAALQLPVQTPQLETGYRREQMVLDVVGHVIGCQYMGENRAHDRGAGGGQRIDIHPLVAIALRREARMF